MMKARNAECGVRNGGMMHRVVTCCTMAMVVLGVARAEEIQKIMLTGSFKGPIGLQLYSLRTQLAKDVPGTLDKVRDLGIRYVELAGTYGMSPEQFKAQLDQHGIEAVSGHFPYQRFDDDPEGVAREAKALGLKYAGCPWIPHPEPFNEKSCRAAISTFNHAGEVLAKSGIKFFYHTHGYEFQPFGQETLFNLLVKETNPKFVSYEMDVFWIVHPGQDPVKLLDKYGPRWELMHLKDMRRGTPTGLLSGHTEVTNDVALGAGQIDLPAVLRAADRAGVKWYFIEDESPLSERQIPQSLQFLEKAQW